MKRGVSLHARVALLALVPALVAMLLVAYSTVHIVAIVVNESMDDKMDFQIGVIQQAIRADGTFDRKRPGAIPDFQETGPGWGWTVEGPRGAWHAGTPIRNVVFADPRINLIRHTYSGTGRTPTGELLHLRRRIIDHPGGPIAITLSVPHDLVTYPVDRIQFRIVLLLILLGLILLLALFLQLRVGLRPLRRLGREVARLRAGESHALPHGSPSELQGLASEVNALIFRNAAGLEQARLHVANLAHALRTPLATLALQLAEEGASAESAALVTQIERHIAHHLRRARSAATSLGERARSDAAGIGQDLCRSLERLHSHREVKFDSMIEEPCWIAVDLEDLSEMLGNLMDNAGRFARSRVRLTREDRGRSMALHVEDDGPGIPAPSLQAALQPGLRLDGEPGGFGFGLAITRELAELYGGAFTLGASEEMGGLKATLILPRVFEAGQGGQSAISR